MTFLSVITWLFVFWYPSHMWHIVARFFAWTETVNYGRLDVYMSTCTSILSFYFINFVCLCIEYKLLKINEENMNHWYIKFVLYVICSLFGIYMYLWLGKEV